MGNPDLRRFIEYVTDIGDIQTDGSGDVDLDDVLMLAPVADTASKVDFEALMVALTQYCEHPSIKEILDQGSALSDRTDEVSADLFEVEKRSINDYMAESDTLVQLHAQIKECDEVLANVEGRLEHFRNNLGSVSDDIRSLDVKSAVLHTRLENRMKAEATLGSWLEDTTVPPELIHDVRGLKAEDPEMYIPVLKELQDKLAGMQAFDNYQTLAAYPLLAQLQEYAAKQVTDVLINKVKGITRGGGAVPGGPTSHSRNASFLKQELQKYIAYVKFLKAHAPEQYERVRSEYIATNRQYFKNVVHVYMHDLTRLLKREDKMRLLHEGGAAQGLRTAMTGMLSAAVGAVGVPGMGAQAESTSKDFELGSRPADLLHPDFLISRVHTSRDDSGNTPRVSGGGTLRYTPIVPANVSKAKLAYEYIFKALMHQLCSAAIGEYTFIMMMFNDEQVFHAVFEWALQIFEGEFQVQLAEYHDVVGTLIMARIANHQHLKMFNAKVNGFSDFFSRVEYKLWPHFSKLIRMQIDSVKNDPNGAKARSLVPSAPCLLPVTQRWCALFVSLALLNREYRDSQVNNSISELAKAFTNLLYSIQATYKSARIGCIFNIINQQYVTKRLQAADEAALCTLQSSDESMRGGGLGETGGEEFAAIRDNLDLNINLYTQECLNEHIRAMCEYVRQAEARTKSAGWTEGDPIAGFGPDKALVIANDFKNRWNHMIPVITTEVQTHFSSSPESASSMLKHCLTSLYEKYGEFQGLLNKQGAAGKEVVRNSVSLHTIRYEFKNKV